MCEWVGDCYETEVRLLPDPMGKMIENSAGLVVGAIEAEMDDDFRLVLGIPGTVSDSEIGSLAAVGKDLHSSITADLEPSGTFGRWPCFGETAATLSVDDSTVCDHRVIERHELVPVRDSGVQRRSVARWRSPA